jgi:signal transduction histidine kinase
MPRNPFGRKTVLVYLLAIVAPALVLLYFGIASFHRQRLAADALLRSNLRLSGEKAAAEIERRATELARTCLPPDAEIRVQKDALAQWFFEIDRGQVVYPRIHTLAPLTLEDVLAGGQPTVREEYALAFREAEAEELRDSKFEAALAGYRKASELPVGDRLQALALQREARCLEKLKRGAEARQIYWTLAERYGDTMDLSHRPYALLAAVALDTEPVKRAALWREAARGRWQLSTGQLEYFASLLGGRLEAGTSPYWEHLQFARALEEQFRHAGRLQPEAVYSFAFTEDGHPYQTFYRVRGGGEDDRLIGFAVNPDWLREQATAAGARLVRKGASESGEIRAGFASLFPAWDLALTPPAGNPARGGPLLQAATTGLVLSLLLMGVMLLIRDLSRDARMNQVRADFVGAVSHELKTPLTVIRLYGETLLEEDDFSAAERLEMYQIITRESDRLTQLIEKVLAFSKIDRGEKQYHLQQADLALVVSRTVATYEQYLKRRGFALETQLAAELPSVRFDEDAVSQALVNLLDNAAKYSGESKSIAVRTYASNGCAVLEVEDQGIGIPHEEQQKIFERFYRVGNAMAKGGYGLGLYLVRHIMDAHQGRVELESDLQRGSRFRLVFPVAGPEAQA